MRKYPNISYWILFFVLVFLDRITKYLALMSPHVLRVCSFLNFSFTWNRGVSWGIFGGASPSGFYLLSTLIAIVIVIFSVYTIMQYRLGEPVLFELFVLAGAISNFFDRIYYGAVIDFIDCHVGVWHWPTFNVADACIVIGAGGIIAKGLLCSVRKG
jgi:signal peptidase II